jgi:hypothetical protein
MTDVVQIDATLLHVEFVKNAVVAYSQLEFGSALKSLVRKSSKSRAHVTHVTLDSITDGRWKGIKCFGKRRRPNLERGGHDLFWLARRVLTGRDLAARLLRLGFHFISELKLILKVVINPRADLLDFLA